MAVYSQGAVANEIIRLTVSTGSPGTWFVFSDVTNAVMLDNLGSGNGIYFKFDAFVGGTPGSSAGYLPPSSIRSFDLRCGSISCSASGTATEVQCVRIT